MLSVLTNRTYRHLFGAQIVALSGTGLATVALGLLAYDLAGPDASIVLGTALTIKMLAYVFVAPVAAAVAERLDRRRMLVVLDLVRAGVAICLPFVSEIWQIYVLIFFLQAASAGFTPAFQATIPDVLSNEKDYTNALSLSRLAVDMESLLSPIFAALLLTFVSFDTLFWGTGLGFVASAALVVSVALPSPKPTKPRGIYDRTTRGIRLYLRTPRLRGLLALSWVAAIVSAMVIVNTVVVVRSNLGLGDSSVALTLASFGGGSMVAAMVLPRLLDRISDRMLMLTGASLAVCAMAVLAVVGVNLTSTLCAWFIIGAGYSATLTPSGRLITRSAHAEDRPALFAAQFTLSHACWLVFYPLSGWLMTLLGAETTLAILTALALPGILVAARLWPSDDGVPVIHDHPDLPPNHPHLNHKTPHAHPIIIDDLHPKVPRD